MAELAESVRIDIRLTDQFETFLAIQPCLGHDIFQADLWWVWITLVEPKTWFSQPTGDTFVQCLMSQEMQKSLPSEFLLQTSLCNCYVLSPQLAHS